MLCVFTSIVVLLINNATIYINLEISIGFGKNKALLKVTRSYNKNKLILIIDKIKIIKLLFFLKINK